MRFSASVDVTEPVVISSESMNDSKPVNLFDQTRRGTGQYVRMKRRMVAKQRWDVMGRQAHTLLLHSKPDSTVRGREVSGLEFKVQGVTKLAHRAGVEVGHGEANLLVWLEAARGCQHLPSALLLGVDKSTSHLQDAP